MIKWGLVDPSKAALMAMSLVESCKSQLFESNHKGQFLQCTYHPHPSCPVYKWAISSSFLSPERYQQSGSSSHFQPQCFLLSQSCFFTRQIGLCFWSETFSVYFTTKQMLEDFRTCHMKLVSWLWKGTITSFSNKKYILMFEMLAFAF